MAPLSPAIIRAEITPGRVRISSSARLIGRTLPAIGDDNLRLAAWVIRGGSLGNGLQVWESIQIFATTFSEQECCSRVAYGTSFARLFRASPPPFADYHLFPPAQPESPRAQFLPSSFPAQ